MTETEETGVPTTAAGRITLPAIFAAFFQLGIGSFGGGMVAWLYREMVERRRWIDNGSFLSGAALGQIMPGSNGVNMAVLLGLQLRRGAGALTAVLALIAGPLAIVLVLAAGYARISGATSLDAFLTGGGAAAIGLMLATGLKLSHHGPLGAGPIAITTATVIAVGVLRWPMLPVIFVVAPVSIALSLVEAKRHG